MNSFLEFSISSKAQEEIAALSQMAEQLNPKIANADVQSVDLDNLFSFLSDVQSTKSNNQILDEIGEKMNELVEDLDEELESVIQHELKMKASKSMDSKISVMESQEPRANGAVKLGQPSLPEPTEPPPPPPPLVPATVKVNGIARVEVNGEPIYESVLPRDENGPTSPIRMNGTATPMANGDVKKAPIQVC